MKCPFCGAEEYQIRSGIIAGKQRYKCRYCVRYYTEGVPPRALPPDKPPILNKCVNCGRENPNPKFCSKACSEAYLSLHPTNMDKLGRRKQPRFCKYCGAPVTNQSRVCKDCNSNIVDWSKRTLGEIRAGVKYQWNGQVRMLARKAYRESGRSSVCVNCGYSIHVDICHIHAINSFSEDTPIPVINDVNNLVALCRNCHWEFDHDELTIEQIERKLQEMKS